MTDTLAQAAARAKSWFHSHFGEREEQVMKAVKTYCDTIVSTTAVALTGYVAGTTYAAVAETDTVLEAFQKIAGNYVTIATHALCTGFSSATGAIAGTDTILVAINKLNGNGKLASNALLTGYSSSAGTVAAEDTVLVALNKLNGNDALRLLTSRLVVRPSTITTGGNATETIAVVGMLANDTILAAHQRVKGANGTAFIAHGGPGAGSISATWTGDPGANAIIDFLVLTV